MRKNAYFSLLRTSIAVTCLSIHSWSVRSADLSPESINYNRDIRPILSANCFYCHGPDEAHQEADLRLDHAQGATRDLGGYRAIVPGDAETSEVMKRILTEDHDDLMPPAESDKKLTSSEKALLRRWIEEGANYESHWSFLKPVRSKVPQVDQTQWVLQPIDAFVLERLEKEGLLPSPEASRETLIRRVTLDLTGLPPSPAEVESFLNDHSGNAYEKVVDRLLQSERYGERMALNWLNAARYADTHGYQNDQERQMWIWRNWVIDAYNQNKPFDQFTVEQIAGDMLPEATMDQKIASAFNRNHRINGEGGVIPEEYRVEYVIDRVETTGSIWLGLSVGCARCHSHKFDPISQHEFYSMFSYFNNVPENGRDGNRGNAEPTLTVPVPGMEVKVARAEEKVEALRVELSQDTPEFLQEFEQWRKTTQQDLLEGKHQTSWSAALISKLTSTGGVRFEELEDGSYLATGKNPANSVYTITLKPQNGTITGIRLETLTHSQLTNGGLARSVNGNFVLTEFELEAQKQGAKQSDRIDIASAVADYSQNGYPIEKSIDGNNSTGWAVFGRPKMKDTTAVFTLSEPLKVSEETVLTIRLRHEGSFNQHAIGRFRLSTTSANEPGLEGGNGFDENILLALKTDQSELTSEQNTALSDYYRDLAPSLAPLRKQLQKAEKSLEQVKKNATTTVMVMDEMEERRPAYFLNRGQYDQPGEEVFPSVPVSLGKLPEDAPNNRLGFAQWLVSSDNPLPARVTVNRYWQMLFGTGLVKSVDDFGAQGEYPSHPELLDWLATEFVRSGWDIKAMLRMIVTSATYRQSSAADAELRSLDPGNRLLARGPRFRLSGEMVRDQALYVSGLLEPAIGGPSVKPYQPAGLWEEVAYDKKMRYVRGSGGDLHRRSMYTFWKRAVAPPSMILFDASGRERCDVARRATNTPLQALVTLNDIQFVEAARFLAQRIIREGGTTPSERLEYAWQLTLVRQPDSFETETLKKSFQHYLAHFQSQPKAAKQLIEIGERDSGNFDSIELAAYTAMANVILNLDETITRE